MPHFLPSVFELLPPPEPAEAFARWRFLPHCVFLDSAVTDARLGRYSFLAADPFTFFVGPTAGPDHWDATRRALTNFRSTRIPELPPFQGGVAGVLGYDLGRRFEAIPPPKEDDFGFPRMALGVYDVVLAWDHQAGQAWIISQGFPEKTPRRRRDRAEKRLQQAKRWSSDSRHTPREGIGPHTTRRLKEKCLAPRFPAPTAKGFVSNFCETAYLRVVERAIEYIRAGDIFQVNLSQRLLHPAVGDPVSLYRRLRACNPAPFSGYFDLGDFQVLSASPERFLHVCDGMVETRPIKGTIHRQEGIADEGAKESLLRSEKDRAENVMIVDLLRNDLGRVCELGSVRVVDVCRLETYATVHHLVSSVQGALRRELDAWDLLAACFPGGSITGAPKIRAMEIIAELEPTARGAYCGAMGYLGFDGSADWNLLIRTITAGRGWWQAPVGGGIVADSDPNEEYRETWQKAEGLIRAMAQFQRLGD